jgi:orotate phosphoribosyltransferase-like protein
MAGDEDRARAHLPEAYARALRLRDDGLTADEIAACLNLEREAGESLLRLADAKLAGVRRLKTVQPLVERKPHPPTGG